MKPLAMLAVCLAAQIAFQVSRPGAAAEAQPVPRPPGMVALRLASLGESEAVSRLMMLYLQSFDMQPGLVIPYRNLDYGRVAGWLEASLELDPRDSYPLFAATGLYCAVNDPQRLKVMLDFVHRAFVADPRSRWRWLAQAVIIAKYQRHDLPLALEYAVELSRQVPDGPPWIAEMQAFTLAQMGRVESAKILLGALVSSGRIRDPNELRFMSILLKKMENDAMEKMAGKKEGMY